MAEYYLTLKALHLIAVISWMAAMLYLPRLYVYHAEATAGSEASEMLKTMERKLLRYIMNPAMIAAWILGLALISVVGMQDGWLHMKFSLLVAMMVFHVMLARWRKAFERDANPHPARFYRWMNEVPTVLMIAIVLLAVIKPF